MFEKLKMIPKEKVKDLKTRNFIMKLKSTDATHVGAYGKLKEIRNDPICMFDLDTMIKHLQNARELLNPDWDCEEDYDDENPQPYKKMRVIMWEHQPALIYNEDADISLQMSYAIAPIIYGEENTKKYVDWQPKDKEE